MRNLPDDTNRPGVSEADEAAEALRLLLTALPAGSPGSWKLSRERQRKLIANVAVALQKVHMLLTVLDPASQLADALQVLSSVIGADHSAWKLSAVRRNDLLKSIDNAIGELQALSVALDPIKRPPFVFDPSDPQQMGRMIADTLLSRPREPLHSVEKFYGSGVYAIYYTGAFRAYQPVSGKDWPVYVGKADPKIHHAVTEIEQGLTLYGRLHGDHVRSIAKVEDYGRSNKLAEYLELDDFECRYLVVKSAWQTTAEAILIQQFRPVWNDEMRVCYGFGKHGDDPGTRSNERSLWDTLHPGREWAWRPGNTPNRLSLEQIKERIAEHYRKHPPR
jgi:Eco29kI-like restriction endonuclease